MPKLAEIVRTYQTGKDELTQLEFGKLTFGAQRDIFAEISKNPNQHPSIEFVAAKLLTPECADKVGKLELQGYRTVEEKLSYLLNVQDHEQINEIIEFCYKEGGILGDMGKLKKVQMDILWRRKGLSILIAILYFLLLLCVGMVIQRYFHLLP